MASWNDPIPMPNTAPINPREYDEYCPSCGLRHGDLKHECHPLDITGLQMQRSYVPRHDQ